MMAWSHAWLTWAICGATVGAVIARPFGLPEAVWAVAGAALLLALGLLPASEGLAGVAAGLDVYLFLIGMMLLAEVARRDGVFDWLAAVATRQARGSARRLFALIYGVGTLVTVFLSNDATAVVLTPAVAAVTRAARVRNPLPYLYCCAFVANAASFVLPISNPANLVIYGAHMPPLLVWLPRFALPSILSIGATFIALYRLQCRDFGQPIADDVPVPHLHCGGRIAALGIGLTTGVLVLVSRFGFPLGGPTAVAGAVTALAVAAARRTAPWRTLGAITWSVVPLVAGLFVLVQAFHHTGVTVRLARLLAGAASDAPAVTTWLSGIAVALASNLTNNLPAGLVAGQVMDTASLADPVRSAILVGVDLGPNLSVSGSLATILWLVALRREGQPVGAWQFLRLGVVIMPAALLPALCALWLMA